LKAAGYEVLNTVSSRKALDADAFVKSASIQRTLSPARVALVGRGVRSMSNFSLLMPEWRMIADPSVRAEALAVVDPRGACFYARRALEVLVNHCTTPTPRSNARGRRIWRACWPRRASR